MKRGKDMENKSENSGLYFLIGIILVSIGLFLLTQNTVVTMQWYTWMFGSFRLATGLILVPFIIGIIMLFFNSKSIIGKIVTMIGLIIIVVTIIMSINIVFKQTSLYNFIIMIGMIAAGSGLLLRWYFKRKK